MKRYALLLIGLAIIVVTIASYWAFPEWRNANGGFLAMLGAVALGVLTATKDVVAIGKDLGWWGQYAKEKPPPSPKPAKSGGVYAGRDINVDRGGVVSDTVIAEKVGGVDHHYYFTKTRQKVASVPIELPPRASYFTGREDELAGLLATLRPGKIVTLTGPGGMGKTALAAEAIWQLTNAATQAPNQFPDGVIFYTFYGQPDIDQTFEHIARTYGAELKPTPLDAARRVLARKRTLLIMDGAEEASNLQSILDIRGNCGVLVTSRSEGDVRDDGKALTALASTEAIALLRAWGQDCVDDDATARQICELVGGLPLALRLAGKYLAERRERAREYLDWLKETPLQALDHGQRRQESVVVLLAKSLQQVSGTAVQALGVVGLLAFDPFFAEDIAAGLGMEIHPARSALGELVKYGLLLRPEKSYQISHALVHTYARRRITEIPADALVQLGTYYGQIIESESEKGAAGYQVLTSVRPHVLAVLESAAQASQWAVVDELAWSVDEYLDIQGYEVDRVRVCNLGLAAVRELGNRGKEGIWLGNLGNAYRATGQTEMAIKSLKQALVIAREINDQSNEGNWLGNLGDVYCDLMDKSNRVRTNVSQVA